MTAARTLPRSALASLLVLGAGACKQPAPGPVAPLTDVEHAKKNSAALEASRPDAAAAAPDASQPVLEAGGDVEVPLTDQKLPPELRGLVERAHAHRAVPSLEAAGCDQALVLSGAAFNRLADLRYGRKMPAQVEDPRADVVWCQRRTPTPPDCAALAPIFARVARPRRPFEVFSGNGAAPFSPICRGRHAKTGKYIRGEGPGYPSAGETSSRR